MSFSPEITNHIGYQYMLDILEERVVSCKYIKWMCLRQYNDLKYGHKRGLYFSSDMAELMLDTIREYRHYKGDFAGQYFEPTPPQVFFNWCLFGWLRNDGTRRFREAYYEVARKNGKTFQGAATGLYMFEADGENAAECYTVATKLKQAKIAHEDAKAIIRSTPELNRKAKVLRDNISIKETLSKYEPLGKESHTEDGLNPSFCLNDEFHAQDEGMYHVIKSGMGGRSQPLLYSITTAGFNLQGPCFKMREYVEKILDPNHEIENDAILGAIYTLDEDDDPFDESVWEKSNPNMPYIPTILPYLRDQAKTARDKPSDLVNFKTKNLNVWCSARNPWLKMEDWNKNDGVFDYHDLIGKPCYAGLDLASTNDLTALCLVFPPAQESIASQRKRYRDEIVNRIRYENPDFNASQMSIKLDEMEDEIENELREQQYIIPDPYYIIPHFFVPEENIQERSKQHGVNYDLWAKDKSVNFHVTPGNTTDYTFVEYELEKLNSLYDIREIDFDPHNASALINSLAQKDFQCVEVKQGWANMTWPSKEFEMLVMMGLLAHNNNPVLTWNAQNVVIHTGPSGNYKPDKKKSKEKIDGIIAVIIALSRAMLHEESTGNDGSLLDLW